MTQNERVKEVRKTLGLTLEKFGDRLGIKKAAVSKIEKGENSLTDQMLKAICREYNVSYDYLANGDGEMFDDLPKTVLDELCVQYDCDSFDRVLIEEYLKLSADDKQVLKDFIKRLSKKI